MPENQNLGEVVDFFHRDQGAPLWLVDVVGSLHLREVGMVLQRYRYPLQKYPELARLVIPVHSQVVWNQTTGRCY